jgi:hypothetical protein
MWALCLLLRDQRNRTDFLSDSELTDEHAEYHGGAYIWGNMQLMFELAW